MSQEDRIKSYLDSLPDGSPERDYYKAVFRLLSGLDISLTEENGFACMMVLTQSRISLIDGVVLGDDDAFPVMGTIEDVAGAVAVIFNNVNSDTMWWKSTYASRRCEMSTAKRAVEIAKLVAKLPIVRDLDSRY